MLPSSPCDLPNHSHPWQAPTAPLSVSMGYVQDEIYRSKNKQENQQTTHKYDLKTNPMFILYTVDEFLGRFY